MKVSERIDDDNLFKKVFGGTHPDRWDDVKDLPIEQFVTEWTVEPNHYSMVTWPVADVSIGDLFEKRKEFLLRGEFLIAGPYVIHYRIIPYRIIPFEPDVYATAVNIYRRKNDEEYWPDEAACAALVPMWTDRLWDALVALATERGVTPKDQWEAYRRYGTKNNSMFEILYITQADPEGRYRFGFVSDKRLPPHVERYMAAADYLVGKRAGADVSHPDNIYSSGQRIDSSVHHAWCQETYGP